MKIFLFFFSFWGKSSEKSIKNFHCQIFHFQERRKTISEKKSVFFERENKTIGIRFFHSNTHKIAEKKMQTFNHSLNRSRFSDSLNSDSVVTALATNNRTMLYDNKSTTNNPSVPTTGRNTFAFWVIVTIIFIMTIGNLILTMTIIGVLRLGKGMEFMEMVPEAETIKFFGVTDFDRLIKKDGVIEGFADAPMNITGSFSSRKKNRFLF